jgi:hypothetical protein
VPAALHDAVASESHRRDVSIAQIVREALVSHLKSRQADDATAS